jgi:hypothetical protein
MNLIDNAKEFIREGYSVIPVTSEKVPAIRDWSRFQKAPMSEMEAEVYFKDVWGIALLCGGVKRLTAFDADLKYDLSGDIFDRFKKALPKEILKKMFVQTTMNGGFHLLFSCDKVEPNQKLAQRYTTCYEQHQTYMDFFNNPETRNKAMRIAMNDKTRVIFETRGGTAESAGGYVVISPSPGYKYVYGNINNISVEEYDVIMETARQFNEVKEVKQDIRQEKYKNWVLSPFDDFNRRFDVVFYLKNNGWDEVKSFGGKSVRLKRPGAKVSTSSALFDTESRVFNCFSTSTLFDVNRGYTASDIFIEMECNGDASLAFAKMLEMGYGIERA